MSVWALTAGCTTERHHVRVPYGARTAPKALDQGSMRGFFTESRCRTPFNRFAKAGGNYLSHCWWVAKRAATAIREGILDVSGYISEGAGENLFEGKGGVLLLPPFSSRAGITRDAIIKLAKSWR